MRKFLLFSALAAAPLAAAAANDGLAYKSIRQADYRTAEAALTAQLNDGTREPGVLLNLAAVYARTGRTTQAAELYRRVQAEQNVQMALPSGDPIWSHDAAAKGLMRTASLQ